jgi:flagellar motor switch protein FliN/FliY
METSEQVTADRDNKDTTMENTEDTGFGSADHNLQNKTDGQTDYSNREIDFLYDVPLQISVEVGRSKILLKDLLQMGEGCVVELDKQSGEPLDLYVNSRLIARGEAVKVGEKFGIRLTEIASQTDRIVKLG